jgi:hypothetical protein
MSICDATSSEIAIPTASKPELFAAIEAFRNQAQQMLDQMGKRAGSSKA